MCCGAAPGTPISSRTPTAASYEVGSTIRAEEPKPPERLIGDGVEPEPVTTALRGVRLCTQAGDQGADALSTLSEHAFERLRLWLGLPTAAQCGAFSQDPDFDRAGLPSVARAIPLGWW